VVVCVGGVALLHFGYSIPGLKLPPYLGFLVPSSSSNTSLVHTTEKSPFGTNTPLLTPTSTRTAVPTYTLVPTRTKAPTWTLLPLFMTQSVTPLPPSTPTATGTPPTASSTPWLRLQEKQAIISIISLCPLQFAWFYPWHSLKN